MPAFASQRKRLHDGTLQSYACPIGAYGEKGGGSMKRRKRTTVWAYLDGKKLVDVVQAALDNNMMVDDMKAMLVRENPGHEVTFKTE